MLSKHSRVEGKVRVSAVSYNEESIDWHEGLEGVRKRPGMYLGERGSQMVFRCVKEAVDNSFDEFMAGRNKVIEVYVDTKTNTYIVADHAEGVPVGLNKKSGLSTLTLVMTKLHAGGKTTAGASSAYQSGSVGTHGVGIAAANAVSSKFEVWTNRSGTWYYQMFSKGREITGVTKNARLPKDLVNVMLAKPKKGTIIRMVPDQKIVSADKGATPAKLGLTDTATWLKNLALMNKGLKISFCAKGKVKTYFNDEGVARVLRVMIKEQELELMTAKPVIFDDGVIAMAVQWTSYTEDDGVNFYVSSSPTRDGGSHADEFYMALFDSIKPYMGVRDKKKFGIRDLRNGLVGVLNYRMSAPEFSSQTKDKLTSNLKKDVYTRVLKAFEVAFKGSKQMARKIIVRATEAKKAKETFKKMMDGIAKVNASKRGVMLPNILAMAKNCKASERELYLVEGDSAAGTAKDARNSGFQEVLRLSGKPPNCVRKPLVKIIANVPVQNFLASVGYNDKATDIYEHMRVNRIYLLADADPDGKHINMLILTCIWRMMPRLLEEGRIFICDAPLYSSFHKGQRYFGATFNECYNQMSKGAPKESVTRAKGWGEVPPEVLEIMAFNPKTRNLIKVLPPRDKADLAYFKHILGSDTAGRKELLGLRG